MMSRAYRTSLDSCVRRNDGGDWGRTTTKTRGSFTATYQYRYGQMLKRVDTNFPGETTTAYIHDGLLKRRYRGVDPSGANTITWWRHDLGWNALAEYAGTGGSSTALGTRQESYVWHGMTPLAEIASSNPGTGTAAYYAHDHLGSTRGLYNASKTSVAATEYEPYGMMTSASTGTPAYQYTGKPWADEVDMYYFPYRYYNANAGRWLTRDPLGMVDGPNVYGYARLNPTTLIDGAGLHVCLDKDTGEIADCGVDDKCPYTSPCDKTRTGPDGINDCQECCDQKFKWSFFLSPQRADTARKCCFAKCTEGGVGTDGKTYWKECKKIRK